MSEQFIDVDAEEFEDAPRGLRDAYKELKRRYTEKATEADTYRSQATSAALGGVLGEFKNPERVKRDLLNDKVDPLDKEAVKQWLANNADDYARGNGAPAPSSPSATDDAEIQAHRRLQSSVDGLSQPADMSKLEAALAEAGPNATSQQIKEIYRKHGV